jgi:60 kDa SS-A/Ro ribonucleoprotein
MKKNSDGAYVFELDKWGRLDRFLILGTEGNTFYSVSQALTLENAENVVECIREDGVRVVATVVEVSTSGRAPKNDQALFVLAMCMDKELANLETRQAARKALPKVARIGTHRFHFAEFAQSFRGWGRGLRGAISDCFNGMKASQVAYHAVKYQSRDGWSNADLLRKAHPAPATEAHDAAFGWMAGKVIFQDGDWRRMRCTDKAKGIWEVGEKITLPEDVRILEGHELARVASSAKEIVDLINDYGLPRESIPTEYLNEIEVWDTLLRSGRGMPMTAMIRNLAKMTSIGLLSKGSDASEFVIGRLSDDELLLKARIHPIQVLSAYKVYGSGQGVRGSLTWTPDKQIVSALDRAFYKAFGNVQPTGKRIQISLDVSPSMWGGYWGGGGIAGLPGLTPAEAAGVMCLVTAAVESDYAVTAFSSGSGRGRGYGWGRASGLVTVKLDPTKPLDHTLKAIKAFQGGWGGTDCSLPMQWALSEGQKFDAFVVYTDNETNSGAHPTAAMRKYRDKTGIPAKLISVGFTATDSSIADPQDAGMLDIVGFDRAAPEILSDFIRS